MKYVGLLFVLTALAGIVFAQEIVLTPSAIRFDTVLVNSRDSIAFRIRNSGNDTLRVADINAHKSAFTIRDTAFVVLPDDSVSVRLYFQTNHNVTWTDAVLIENSGARGTIVLPVRGTAKYADASYATTQGLWENELKSQLLTLVNNHTVLGYNAGRDRMFETIDDPTNVDTIECVYTGRKVYARTRTEAQNQNFNTEHSWPQSTFGSADPMVSDIFHLFPVDETANSQRSNYPFGPVVSNIIWQVGGSKLGRNPNGQTAFEPRDVHTGDVARAMFYFLIRYPNNYGSFMDANQEFYLRQWYRSDLVSQKEILRNNAIATYQGKRNPLVDHPEFIDRISYFRSTVPPQLQPDIVVSPTNLQFRAVAFGDSSDFRLTIVNHGKADLAVSSVALQTSTPALRILDVPISVSVDSFWTVRVRFKPDTPNQVYTNAIVIQSNDPDAPTVSVNVAAFSTGTSSVAYTRMPAEFVLYQNYPNPFNPTTTVSFSIGQASSVSLKVFDVLGRVVASLVNDRLQAGTYNTVWNAAEVPSGAYVYRLETGRAMQSRRMLLIK
jgi:endonuclease I